MRVLPAPARLWSVVPPPSMACWLVAGMPNHNARTAISSVAEQPNFVTLLLGLPRQRPMHFDPVQTLLAARLTVVAGSWHVSGCSELMKCRCRSRHSSGSKLSVPQSDRICGEMTVRSELLSPAAVLPGGGHPWRLQTRWVLSERWQPNEGSGTATIEAIPTSSAPRQSARGLVGEATPLQHRGRRTWLADAGPHAYGKLVAMSPKHLISQNRPNPPRKAMQHVWPPP